MSRYVRMTGGALAAVAIAALGLSVATTQGWAQDEAEAEISVGTYDPEQVFNAYPDRQEMMDQITELQGQMQQAQQQQDQERMMQLQQQAQQYQTEAIEKFQGDVEAALPGVAEAHGLDLVAIEVSWSRDGVGTEDVTTELIEELGGDPEPAEPQFMVPGAE